jgi:hypothetical protein
MESPDPGVPEAALPPPAPTVRTLEFRGSAAEYFRIWIINLALTLVTLGIYSAWVSRRQGARRQCVYPAIVVLTDGLAKLSRHDDELRAVFAHENGHVQHRHAMRALLSSSRNALLAVAILGDVTSATTLIAGVPVTLAHAANSREFEREADAVARRWMQQAGVPPHRLGDLLQRLAAEHDHGGWNYLSSHPPLVERLQDTSD